MRILLYPFILKRKRGKQKGQIRKKTWILIQNITFNGKLKEKEKIGRNPKKGGLFPKKNLI